MRGERAGWIEPEKEPAAAPGDGEDEADDEARSGEEKLVALIGVSWYEGLFDGKGREGGVGSGGVVVGGGGWWGIERLLLHAIVLVLHRGGGEGVGLVLLLLLLLLLAVACMWEVIALRNLRKCRLLLLLLLPAHQSHLNRGVVEGVTRGARQKRLRARVA
jgi:hypothetical protein